MKVTVRKDRNLIIVNARNTQNENDVETIEITVPEEYENFNKKIAFITDDGVVWDFIENNKYTLTNAITKYKKVKFYIWLTQDNKDFRSEERTIVFNKNQDANEEVTEEEISGFNKMINILEEEITEVTGLQEDLTNLINTVQTKLDNGDFKGDKGDKGDPGESYDDTEIKEEISDIKEEQTTQNTRIEELEEQVQELENNQLTGTATGQSIYIEDSTNTKVRSIGLSGNSEQESTTGKNLFSGDYSQFDSIGGEGNLYAYFKLPNDGETYTLTAIAKNSFSGTGSTFLGFTSKGGETSAGNFHWIITNNINVNKGDILTFSTNESRFISLYSKSQNTLKTLTDNFDIQLEKSSTRTDYEPYTGGQASPNPSYPQEIHSTGDSGSVNEKVQNKNLWSADLPILFKIDGTDNIIPNDYGGIDIKLSSNQTFGYVFYDLGKISDYKNKTLTFSISNEASSRYKNCAFINCASDGSNRTELKNMGSSTNILTYSVNGTYTKSNLAIRFYISEGTTNTTYSINNIQVEENTIASSYQAHEEQNISFPLAQGQKLMQGDYLADDGVHHVRGEEVLDGTENITIGTGGVSEPTNKYFDITKTTNIAKNNTTLKCTHFIQRTIWGVDQIGINYEGAANSKSVRIRANFSTIEDFKSWLAEQYTNGTPVKVQYELATEVIDSYTSEQQAVWDQIKALRTYKPVTHISSTDEVPATVNVTYVKDLETVINNLGGA